MVFSSSQEQEFDVNVIFLLENSGPVLGAFKDIYHHFWKRKIGTKLSE